MSEESRYKPLASRIQQAGTTSQQHKDFVSANMTSVWSQLLANVPKVRNKTHYYAHDALRAATNAVGSVATTMQKHVAAQKLETTSQKTAFAPQEQTANYGFSRLAFIDSSKPVGILARRNSDEFEATSGQNNIVSQSSLSERSSDSPLVASNTTDQYNQRFSATAAASAATKATTTAAASLATGLYNILNAASMTPELHYAPGESLYGSTPSSVAAYIGTSSPTAVAALAPFVPPYGHPSPPPMSFSTAASPSLAVISASIQNVVTQGAPHQLAPPLSSSTSQITYLSLALQDGFAVFEVDGAGVSEVVASLKGDRLLTNFLLKHSLQNNDAQPVSGAPPQPVPQQFLDLKVVENSNLLWENNPEFETTNVDITSKNGKLQVSIISPTPLVTLAFLTDVFQHYRYDKTANATVCEKHQRIMVVQCLPSCILEGDIDTDVSTTAKNSEMLEYFVPLANDCHQQQTLAAQVIGNPFSSYLNQVTAATAGLLYRVVSHITLVDEPTLVSISPKAFATDSKVLSAGSHSSRVANSLIFASTVAINEKELFSHDAPFTVPKKKMYVIGYTSHKENKSTTMQILRTFVTNNGVHSVAGDWLAFAGAPSVSTTSHGAQPMPIEPQTIFRSETVQSGKEYYAKAASTGWSKIGEYLGLKEKVTSNATHSTAKGVVVDTDGDFRRDGSPKDEQACPPIGVITLCDVSALALVTSTNQQNTLLCEGYYHDFASFAAHSHPIQCVTFDSSGTLLATASTSGTSVNVYQVSKSMHLLGDTSKQSPSRLVSNSEGLQNERKNGQYITYFDTDEEGAQPIQSEILGAGPQGTFFAGEVTLLYRLLRGTTSAVITNLAFSPLSMAIGIATSLGTCHFHLLDDDHEIAHEAHEQVQYYKNLNKQSENTATINESQGLEVAENSKNNRPFACFRVGIRGELASQRKAPLTGPICRARSSVSTPPPWPLLAFRPLPLYRLRAAVSVMREKRDKLNPNNATAAQTDSNEPSETLAVPLAVFDAFIFCPSYLSVTHVQFSSEGDAVTLSTVSLSQFTGPKWQNKKTPLAVALPMLPQKENKASNLYAGSENIAWLLQQERHCARSSDFGWAHVGKLAYEIKQGAIATHVPTGTNVTYRCDYGKVSNSQKLVPSLYENYTSFFLTADDTELDAIAAQAAESEEWDEANRDSPFDDTNHDDEDFIVA